MDNWRQDQANQGRNYGNFNQKGQYYWDGKLQLRQKLQSKQLSQQK